MLLTVLLIETMFLYSRLASAIALQRRERTNRLLSVEAVTGAIAHELRTPLGAIALNADTALSQLRSVPPNLEDMEEIIGDMAADSHRAAAIISSIRDMTTKTVHRSALTNAKDVARLALRLLRHDLQVNEICLTTQFQDDLPLVQIDGIELQQVLLNVIRNSIDAMVPSTGERQLRLAITFDGQATISLTIQDTGSGVSIDDQKRIFDPFFTTKSGGMGLGLAISSTLVANHGGKLRLIKSDQDGSIFEIVMTAAGNHPAA
jgi:signal transduction histidine kinase